MTDEIIRRLVETAGFEIVATHRPEETFIEVGEDLKFPGEPTLRSGQYTFGQGICVAHSV
ncbi:MAG: hypothetical protein P8N02_18530 [Actinomycetota bacterium]|nr:hypothetical protein [Actinomycetota bacterium]